VGGIKYKMNVGWVEAWNPTPAWVTLPLTHPTNNCAYLLTSYQLPVTTDQMWVFGQSRWKNFHPHRGKRFPSLHPTPYTLFQVRDKEEVWAFVLNFPRHKLTVLSFHCLLFT